MLRTELKNAIPHQIPDCKSTKYIDINVYKTSLEATCYTEDNALVARAGTALSQPECNYTPVEKSLLTMIMAYKKFYAFLQGRTIFKTNLRAIHTALHAKEKTDRVNRLLLQLPPEVEYEIQVCQPIEELETIKRSDEPPEEIFYTDGACTGNGKPNCRASWAVRAKFNNALSQSGIVQHPRPSNQVAEIVAAIKACEIAKNHKLERIAIVTDSKYVADSLNKWIECWESNGWKDNRGKQIVNEQTLKLLARERIGLDIKCLHVKGHSNDIDNDLVDQMARTTLEETFAIAAINSPIDIDQNNDDEIKQVIDKLSNDPLLQDKFIVEDGQLNAIDPKMPIFNRKRLYVPNKYREQLLRIAHDDPIYGSHLGVKKTKNKLYKYYWPVMNSIDSRYK